jgi:predicted ATP-dependent serine protease
MTELKQKYRDLTESISQRITVQNTIDTTKDYQNETDRLLREKLKARKSLIAYYDDVRHSRHGGYETLPEYMDRMENTLEVDDDGLAIIVKYRLGVDVIDEEFLNGKGVTSSALVSIGAESGVGKSSFAFMIMGSLAKQAIRTHFCSLEMGDIQMFSEINPQEKNKLKSILKTDYAENITIDFSSRDVDDLATTIQTMYDEGVRAFVIDSYISIYTSGSEYDKMKTVVDMLATLKKELGILIIIIAQISKSDARDSVFDFHGGNILKYESDLALFIKKLEGEEDSTKRHIHCEKNRIFEEKVGYGIVTDYDRVEHKVKKLSNFNDYAGVGHDGKELKPLKGFGKKK